MQEITCPECGSANPVSEDMCDQCGALLTPATTGRAEPEPDETCPGCGKGVSADMKFCNGCGMALRQAPPPPPPPIPVDPAGDTVVTPVPVQAVPPEPEPESEPEPELLPEPLDDDPEPDAAETIWKLTCVEGFRVGKQYLLYKDDMMLGRLDAESEIYPDIELEDQDDGFVSRRHARIRRNGNRVTVQDLGGENGTFLDGRPLPPMKEFEVSRDQVIRLGKVSLMLTTETSGGPR